LDQGHRHGARPADRQRNRHRAWRHHPRGGQPALGHALRHRGPGDARTGAGGGLSVAGEHILVVDDEPAIQGTLRAVLEDEGYRVTTAGAGDAAVRAVTDEAPDVVFLDIWMPGMDGLETLAELKRVRPGAPGLL